MEMHATSIISCPLDKLSAYVMDVSNDTNWRHKVDESGFRSGDAFSPGSIGFTRVGELEVEWKILSSDAGSRVEWEFLNGPFAGRGGYHFKAVEGGTQFTLLAHVEPTGIYRILGPVFQWVGRRRNQSDVEKLRKILEA